MIRKETTYLSADSYELRIKKAPFGGWGVHDRFTFCHGERSRIHVYPSTTLRMTWIFLQFGFLCTRGWGMKRYIKSFLLAMLSLLLMVSCGDSYLGIQQVVTSTVPPEKVTVNKVVAKSGALEIHFSLPVGNPNIAQVVASYTSDRGEHREFKASRYTASILVEGFTGTDEKTVELICIDASGNKSEVTVVQEAPLLSPVELAFNTLEAEPIFGGVKVGWENKDAQPFAIHILTEDVLQVGTVSLVEDPAKTIYNRDSTNTFAYVRQYPSVEQKFGFVISDKWGNRTDTLLRAVTPFQEEAIDWRVIRAVSFFNPTLFNNSRDWGIWGVNPATGLQNDGNAHAAGNAPQTIFNGVRSGNELYIYKFVKNLADPNPANREIVQDVYVTYDLNMDVRLSRIVIFPRVHISYTYARSSPKRFRIWGTNDANSQRWTQFPETWTLIGEYEGREPVNRASLTAEEIDWFNNNQEYSIIDGNVNPEGQPTTSFRYMRLQLMESYNTNEPYYTINEFEMFGVVERSY